MKLRLFQVTLSLVTVACSTLGCSSTTAPAGTGGNPPNGGGMGSATLTGSGGASTIAGSSAGPGGPSGGATSNGGAGGASSATGGAAQGGASRSGGVSERGGSAADAGGATDAAGLPMGAGGARPVTGGATSGTAGATTGGGGAAGSGGATVIAGAIYVSPSGDDTNPGSLSQPLKTVGKARDLVRTRNGSMSADITVYLRGGTYPLTDTVALSNSDSGGNGFYVKYLAYPNERPILSGAVPITGWKATDANKAIYSAPAPAAPFRQLYVNGVKAIRARSPNLGANGAPSFNRLTGSDKAGHSVQVASSAVGSWNNLTKVEMHMMLAWADNTLRIASVTPSGNNATIKFQTAEDAILYVRPFAGLGSNSCYYFENALEFLDQPGEWYLDETAKVVYYMPRTGEDMTSAVVVAPMVETLVSINGTSTSSQASYIWFQGIAFLHSTWMRPSQYGFLDGQAGQYNLSATADNKQYVGRPAAGVEVKNANHIHFERNLFAQMGATGLDFISGTHDDTIIGNVFTDIAGNGISVGKFTADETTEFHVAYNPTDANEICTNDTIKDNLVDNVTTEFQGACGIACGYPRQIDIEHNEVSDVNYTGISVGYGWTAATNAMSNNKIDYNNVHNVVKILADGGGIYTLSNQGPASEIQYNYLHDYSKSQWADYGVAPIYLDEGTTGYTVAHNAQVNAPTGVTRNHNGTDTVSDTPATSSQSIISSAGLEAGYADIKNLTIPVPSF